MRFLLPFCLLLLAAACGEIETANDNTAMDNAMANPVAITNPDTDLTGASGMQTAFERIENAVQAGDVDRAREAATALEVAYKGTDTGRQPMSEPLEQTPNEFFRAKLTEFQLSKTNVEQQEALEGLREALEGLF